MVGAVEFQLISVKPILHGVYFKYPGICTAPPLAAACEHFTIYHMSGPVLPSPHNIGWPSYINKKYASSEHLR
jgi:hypothetical protein